MNVETANRLMQLRKKAGLSQEELADKLNVSRQAVSKWECAESSPDTDNLIALSKIYGVTLDELINGESEAPKQEKKEEPFIHIKSQDGDEVKINGININVTDDEGNEVRVGKDGVHINATKRSKKKDDDDDDDDFIDFKAAFFEAHPHWRALEVILTTSIIPLLVVIAYLLLGFLLPNGEGWAKWWVLFFLIPLIPSVIEAIIRRKFCAFAYPVFAAALFLTLGMFVGIWHPTWIIFITIPIYYCIFAPIDAIIRRRPRVQINSDVIDNE